MPRPVKRNKEEIAESSCFLCKDGGFLRICDNKNCFKVYHPQCVQKDDSFLENDERWFCGWHYCVLCGKSAKFQCFSCPIAVCGRCLCDSEFAVLRQNHGLCCHCLELGLLLEDKDFAVSDKRTVNFDDMETFEYLFKLYWETVKQNEGLTLGHLRMAHGLLKQNKNYKYDFDTNENVGREYDAEFQVDISDSSSDQTGMGSKKKGKTKRAGRLLSGNARQRKENSKKKEFLGWATRSLLDFLQSVGKDTSEEMSESHVASIIIEYCRDQKLFHPEKRKKINCDKRLQLLFGKKSFSKNSICKLLQIHFAENIEESEEGEDSFIENDGELAYPSKQRKIVSDERYEEKESQGGFASIVPGNIKLVYLKRSLVEELAKQLDTFESKMIGSFVRVRSDPNDCFQRNPRQLVQVTGIKRTLTDRVNPEIHLQVSNLLKEVSILDLLDDDFTEEECQDLCQRMKDGLPMRPTVGELQEKARVLHEDITKHWIANEIVLLQRRIDQANEKGWRRELYDYIDKKQLLKSPSEQERLLREIPVVIADRDEIEDVSNSPSKKDQHGQDVCTGMAFEMSPKTPRSILEMDPFLRQHGKDYSGVKQLQHEASVFDEPLHRSDIVPAETDQQQIGVLEEGQTAFGHAEREQNDGSNISKNRNCQPTTTDKFFPTGVELLQPKVSVFDKLLCQSDSVAVEADQQEIAVPEKQSPAFSQLSPKLPSTAVVSQPGSVHTRKEWSDGSNFCRNGNLQLTMANNGKKIAPPTIEVIELSDSEEPEGKVAVTKNHFEDLDASEWFCIGSRDNLLGPHSLAVLKQWNDTREYKIPFMVFRRGHRREDAIPLSDVLSQSSSPAGDDQTSNVHQEQQQHLTDTTSDKKPQEQDQCFTAADEMWRDPHCKIWFCACPDGSTHGPYSMTVLRKWHDTSTLDIPYKVFRSGQRAVEAVPLAHALEQIFNAW